MDYFVDAVRISGKLSQQNVGLVVVQRPTGAEIPLSH
jgi:hypothetical protein